MLKKKSSLAKLPNFQNPLLLETALTHRSALNEKLSQATESNERLEFLGDAVLELVSSEYLYQRCTTEPEGILTAYRSALVKTTTLAKVAQKLQLGERLYLSRGEESTGGRANMSLLADTVEAVIGALYLDQGYAAAQSFIAEHILSLLDDVLQKRLYKDAKSDLQELVQAKKWPTPEYRVIEATGPDHEKEFVIEVVINNESFARGEGKSKQIAQQQAAAAALEKFNSIGA
ncbi:ribonuclease III [Candidatus Woesebacteria bacterium]|nr:ribonuclease III [Candidatus Woesebacteria bacterium]